MLVAPIVDVEDVLDTFTTGLGIGPRTRRDLGRRISARTDMPLSAFSASELMPDPLPTLVLHDRTDHHVPYESSERLDREHYRVSLVVTSGFGHHRILRDPTVVSAAVGHVNDEPSARRPHAAPAGLAS